MKREMIRGERRLNSCKNKNLATWTNFEDRSAAVAHVKIFVAVECNARGNAHPFNPLLGAALRRNPVNRAVVPAGHEEIPSAVHRQPAGIYKRSDERFYAVIRR